MGLLLELLESVLVLNSERSGSIRHATDIL